MGISKKRLNQIKAIPDSAIDYSEIAELRPSFWKKAKVTIPEPKKAISLRIDDQVLNWFKSQGSGYQTLMNAVLKSYMQARTKTVKN